jgi:ribose transport system ATP-binding protein
VEQSTPLVSIRGLTKTFGGQRALDGVDLTIMPREIHGLLGENGSGKSTLIKVLSGFHRPESGTLEVAGSNVPLPLMPGQYRQLGFEFVHQDLGLVPSLTVTENLYMGEIARSRALLFSWSAARRRAAATFARYHVNLDPGSIVENVRPVDRAMLAIVRAVETLRRDRSDQANLLILDEPTVFLPKDEIGLLFSLMRRIAAEGSSVLFVSHDLDEVREITDRVTVLRDGRTSGTATTAEASSRDLVRMIIGHDLAGHAPVPTVPAQRRVAMCVRDLKSESVSDINFDLHEGEVLGFAGLIGSGYEDVLYSLFGAESGATGSLAIDGKEVDIGTLTPRRAMSLGMALVPADRKNDGSVATLSMAENVNLTVLDAHFVRGRLQMSKLRENAWRQILDFDVRPPLPDLDYGSFSGGNQQKALMAKWQQIAPKVLLLHEPTQGVDIGARAQIFDLIRRNTAVSATICASSEYEQLEAICDRVGIFVRGRLVTFVTGADITKARIADLCHAEAAGAAGPSSAPPV